MWHIKSASSSALPVVPGAATHGRAALLTALVFNPPLCSHTSLSISNEIKLHFPPPYISFHAQPGLDRQSFLERWFLVLGPILEVAFTSGCHFDLRAPPTACRVGRPTRSQRPANTPFPHRLSRRPTRSQRPTNTPFPHVTRGSLLSNLVCVAVVVTGRGLRCPSPRRTQRPWQCWQARCRSRSG
jgi:hypothetical protein